MKLFPSASPVSSDYEVSAHYVSSTAKVLEHQRLLHLCPPQAAPMLENPWARWWWPGRDVESVFVAVRRHAGDGALRTVSEALLRQHMLPRAAPVVSWLVSLSGVKPGTLLSRLDLFARTMLRGVSFEWALGDPRSGTVRVRYPTPAQDPEVTMQIWRGLLAQTFVLTHVDGEVTAISCEGGVMEAQLAWK